MNKKPSAINIIWLYMVLIAVVVASYKGTMAATTKASIDSAKDAVTLAIGLIGMMALWLGIMRVVEVGGMMNIIARAIRPLTVRLFPEVPPEHPAMSAIIMNMAANMLGLGNAATPMGIKAMQELDKLNPEKGTATNAMCLFLAINTSSLALLPLGVITVRAAAGAADPGSIFIPSIIATACSTAVAIVAAKLMALRSRESVLPFASPDTADGGTPEAVRTEALSPPGLFGKLAVFGLVGAFVVAIVLRFVNGAAPPVFSMRMLLAASGWLLPILMCGFLLFGYLRGVKIYEAITDGAKEGFNVAIRIIPFLVAIFVAIGMFRASGALDMFVTALSPVLSLIGMPPEALPMALLRPLSGTGAFAFMSEVVNRDPNGFVSFLVSTMQGSTETTFYVLAVYFGSVGIRRSRHALPVGLLADGAGFVAALAICRLMY